MCAAALQLYENWQKCFTYRVISLNYGNQKYLRVTFYVIRWSEWSQIQTHCLLIGENIILVSNWGSVPLHRQLESLTSQIPEWPTWFTQGLSGRKLASGTSLPHVRTGNFGVSASSLLHVLGSSFASQPAVHQVTTTACFNP